MNEKHSFFKPVDAPLQASPKVFWGPKQITPEHELFFKSPHGNYVEFLEQKQKLK